VKPKTKARRAPPVADAIYFDRPAAFRAWLERNGSTARELWGGLHRGATGKPSLTWPESVDEALCFGWIDGIRRRVDAGRYAIRFTPRRPGSTWSAVNIARARELARLGRMRPAGLAAFQARTDERSAIHAHEQRRKAAFTPGQERALRADQAALAFFEAQPPSYRRLAAYWVTSAKQEETRQVRFASLLACSAAGQLAPPFRWSARKR
jgi:uncharacterized protein YdeI (YjbR/CyaY-like superfamily)